MTLVWNHYYQPVLYKFHYHFYTYLLAFRARRSCLISCTHLFILFTVEWVWDSQFSQGSVSQFRHSVMSDSLQSHGLQHTRLPCPSPTPWVYSNSCPLSRRFHPTISSLVVPFSSCPQSFQASESFPMSQLFSWGGQSIGVSATGYNNLSYIANSRFSCIHSTNANASPWFKYYRWPSPQKRYVC